MSMTSDEAIEFLARCEATVTFARDTAVDATVLTITARGARISRIVLDKDVYRSIVPLLPSEFGKACQELDRVIGG